MPSHVAGVGETGVGGTIGVGAGTVASLHRFVHGRTGGGYNRYSPYMGEALWSSTDLAPRRDSGTMRPIPNSNGERGAHERTVKTS